MDTVSAESLWASVRATSAAEWLAVATGVVYILLIVRRNRWGWLAGGISSLIFTVLFARSGLPMQALLQASYVAGAAYGWWSWAAGSQSQPISVWTLRGHLLTVLVCLVASLGLARLLKGESAFPFTDSLVACAGLFATWLVARVYLENWAYWMVIDAVSIYLCVAQGLIVTAGLFAIYLVIAALGLRSWWRIRRDPPAT
ncbi:MAG: nicotinamide riboside transporter PnuC [Steroidobacteraceae bacterium]